MPASRKVISSDLKKLVHSSSSQSIRWSWDHTYNQHQYMQRPLCNQREFKVHISIYMIQSTTSYPELTTKLWSKKSSAAHHCLTSFFPLMVDARSCQSRMGLSCSFSRSVRRIHPFFWSYSFDFQFGSVSPWGITTNLQWVQQLQRTLQYRWWATLGCYSYIKCSPAPWPSRLSQWLDLALW